MFPLMAADSGRVQLERGDWLLVFSDGIPEAENEQGEEFGDEGILGMLAGMSGGAAPDVCAGIVAGVRKHLRNTRQGDDITLIAMRVE
jgi:energy-coupling factor transport system substrate-specific component